MTAHPYFIYTSISPALGKRWILSEASASNQPTPHFDNSRNKEIPDGGAHQSTIFCRRRSSARAVHCDNDSDKLSSWWSIISFSREAVSYGWSKSSCEFGISSANRQSRIEYFMINQYYAMIAYTSFIFVTLTFIIAHWFSEIFEGRLFSDPLKPVSPDLRLFHGVFAVVLVSASWMFTRLFISYLARALSFLVIAGSVSARLALK